MQTLKSRIVYFIWASVIAASFFLLTYEFIYRLIANEDVSLATLLNAVVVILLLILGKVETTFAAKLKAKPKREQSRVPPRISALYYNSTDVSIKAALYLYYIGLLLCVFIVIVNPDFPVLHNLADYFLTVEYSILILIATDVFLEQMFKATS